MPYVRGKRYAARKKSGYGLAIWPDANRSQLDLWLARTRGERTDEVYVGPGAEITHSDEGSLVLRLTPGTKRSYE